MKTLTQGIWQSLWQSHRQTKRLLNIFAYHKDSTARKGTNQDAHQGADQQSPKQNPNKEPDEKKPYKTPQLVGLILECCSFFTDSSFLSTRWTFI